MLYDWILFDADETLFSFDRYLGLKNLFSQLDIDFTLDEFEQYQKLNSELWLRYQDGKITAQQLKEERFFKWSKRLNISASELNTLFIEAMVDISAPLDDVTDLIPKLAKKAKLGIITNGFTQLQQIRLEKAGLQSYFDVLVISESVEIAKPDVAIFEYAFKQMGNPDKSRILMVGDSLSSDILGGNNAGIDTCWLNLDNKAHSDHIKPTFIANSWQEVAQLLQV